jgi:4-amino-4-deoxy-L-arabinose transferase-like glycosyltransferase
VIKRNPFAAWTVVGVLLGLSITALFIVTLPLTIIAIIYISRRTKEPDDALGLLAGVGLVLLLIASANTGPGGLNSTSWLIAGLASLGLGLGLHALIGRLAARGENDQTEA